MKKAIKLLAIFLVMLFLTGCEKKNHEHEHKLEHINLKLPTCTEDGVVEHWECTTCGKYFSDEYEEIQDVTLKTFGHRYSTKNIEWEWSENYEEATAILSCINDPTHKERIQAVVTKEESSLKETYTATITYEDVEYTNIQPETFDLEYELNPDNTSCRVTGIGGAKDPNVVIPSEYKGFAVTSIGESAFRDCINITSIEIPESVTSIGDSAFLNCSSLTSIEIPESVTSIGDSAFLNCSSLTNIILPNSITSIGKYAFYGCSSLSHIDIPNKVTTIEVGTFGKCDSLSIMTIPNSVTTIKSSAFTSCDSLAIVYIPNSIISIGQGVFEYCESLQYNEYGNGCYLGNLENPYMALIKSKNTEIENLTIHNDTKMICPVAFHSCNNLTSVTIPDGVISIGSGAFSVCDSLTSITISSSVTNIGENENAFYHCDNLTSIKIDENNPVYDSRENCNAIIETATNTLILGCQNTTIPNGVTSIGKDAFYYCANLISITLPDSVTSIESHAFCFCSGLTSITFGNGLTTIGDAAFNYCKSLTSIILPDSLISIGEYAFRGCSDLTNIILGNSVTSIGSYAFYECRDLMNIIIPNSVTSIGSEAFDCCSKLTSITIPNSVTSIGSHAFANCYDLTIYCEATSKPSGWDQDWNWSNLPVVWGYKNE